MVQVVEQIRVEAPSERVWAVLADLGGVAEWNPTVDHAVATSEASGGLGAARSCAVGGMGTVEETVVAWDEGREMLYEVEGAAMMRRMRAGFTLAPVEAGAATLVTMRGDFAMRGGPLGALMATTVGRRKLRGTMRSVLAGLRAHVQRYVASEGLPLLREGPPPGRPNAPNRRAEAAATRVQRNAGRSAGVG